jgi:hypothetical protein
MGGDDEKGKGRRVGQSRPLYQSDEKRGIRILIGWQRPWPKDGQRNARKMGKECPTQHIGDGEAEEVSQASQTPNKRGCVKN